MTTFASSYIKILSHFVEYYHRNEPCVSPRKLYRAKFFARTLCVVNHYGSTRLGSGTATISQSVDYLKARFGPDNFLSKVVEMIDPELVQYFDSEKIIASELWIGDLYETLLNYETAGLTIKEGKSYRNNLGSYYTPKDFAEYMSTNAIEAYVKANGKGSLSEASIVDFSCGCGIFLISALKAIRLLGYKDEEISGIVDNIYACDVDPIALELAKISVLDYCDVPGKYGMLSGHFQHANFLLHDESDVVSSNKLDLAMEGYIYHSGLALGNSFLQEYDIILGNPPWEKIRLEEKKFFGQFVYDIQYANFKFALSHDINDARQNNPYIREYSDVYLDELNVAKTKIKSSSFFADSSVGELNTCSLFSDAAYKLLSGRGVAGLLVKSSLFTSKVNTSLFQKMLKRITAIYDFINTKKIFGIDGRERFSIVMMGKGNGGSIHLGMNLTQLSDISTATKISISTFGKLNPETKMLPNLKSTRDLQILSSLYERLPIFAKEFRGVKFGRLVHLTNHINDIDRTQSEDNIPIFEGKFFSLFDNSYSGFNDIPFEERYKNKASSRKFTDEERLSGVSPESRFFIRKDKWDALSKGYNSEYMLAWHSLTSATNARSCISTLLPFIPAAQSVQFLITGSEEMTFLAGLFNSITFDYIVKNKLSGIDLTQTIINQIPVPSLKQSESMMVDGTSAREAVISIVSKFYVNEKNLRGLFPLGYNGKVNQQIDRRKLFFELDAIVARLYQLSEEDFAHILHLFGSFYTKEEQNEVYQRFIGLGQ